MITINIFFIVGLILIISGIFVDNLSTQIFFTGLGLVFIIGYSILIILEYIKRINNSKK